MKKLILGLVGLASLASSAVYANNCPKIPEEEAEQKLVLATAIKNGHYKISGDYCMPLPKKEDYKVCKAAKEADEDKNGKVSSLEAEIYLEEACKLAKNNKHNKQ